MPRRSVLIVDDVEEMSELLRAAVDGMAQFRVGGVARNVAEARLELDRRRPDLVLLDEVLPGESSLDLLETLVAEKIPVILITSMQDRKTPLPPGALDRLNKPGWKTVEKDRQEMESRLIDALHIKKVGATFS